MSEPRTNQTAFLLIAIALAGLALVAIVVVVLAVGLFAVSGQRSGGATVVTVSGVPVQPVPSTSRSR